jgi:ribosomal protein L4
MLDKVSESIISKLEIEKDKREDLIRLYYRILSLNRIQFNRYKIQAGRNYAVKPSGTGKGQSRLPRVAIPGKGLVPKARCSIKGGPRGYHDRLKKKVFKLNKKMKKFAIRQILINSILYSYTYVVDNIELQKRKELMNQIKIHLPNASKYKTKVKRVYRKYAKIAVLIHDQNSVELKYKNTQIDTVNLLQPDYTALNLNKNSNHLVIISSSALHKILNEKI